MCDHHADCIDLDGKYDCKCHIGYAGNGFECINIDECVTSTFLCTTNSGEIFRVSFYGRLHIGVFRYIRNQKIIKILRMQGYGSFLFVYLLRRI